MFSVETEIQILIEPRCLIHSVSRGIIRGKLMSLRKTFKILYQRLRTAVGNTRRARFEESHLIHSKKIKRNNKLLFFPRKEIHYKKMGERRKENKQENGDKEE